MQTEMLLNTFHQDKIFEAVKFSQKFSYKNITAGV